MKKLVEQGMQLVHGEIEKKNGLASPVQRRHSCLCQFPLLLAALL
jgi:hypothetical protein